MAIDTAWVKSNYDADGNCIISQTELNKAVQDNIYGRITDAQLDMVSDCFRDQTNLCQPTATPAEGSIVNVSYPTNAKNNERISIRASIKNSGGSPGNFKLYLYRGSTKVAYSTTQTIAAGSTGASKTMYVTTPSSGTVIDYQIRCVRIT